LGLDAQYNSSGICPYNEDGTYAKGSEMPLAPAGGSGSHIIEVTVVDQGLIGCGVEDPTVLACRREHFFLYGNVEAPGINHIVQ
jgi:hypothetical protein